MREEDPLIQPDDGEASVEDVPDPYFTVDPEQPRIVEPESQSWLMCKNI